MRTSPQYAPVRMSRSGAGEGHENGVALGVYLDALCLLDSRTEQNGVTRQDLAVGLIAELFE